MNSALQLHALSLLLPDLNSEALYNLCTALCILKPNTHRRRDETVLSRRVGVGGVYWA